MENQLIEALHKQVELLEQIVRAKDALILELQLKQTIIHPQVSSPMPIVPWSPFFPPYIITADSLQLIQPANIIGQNGK